uniref:DnaJ homolog subfamily C member 4 n=1 Tax=Macaca mulatta TaxID=9544 RepID=A0A5F7ZAG1_MACMU|nr:dnaJ homolog subfamily C member 4 isoform X7 [Macaca nemestrina]XP_015290026.1 PREDICTED: dnaJ homolog subfamily C member 4 isoform X6 [Macaca fascicularis]
MPETLQRETDLSWDLFQPSQLLVAELKGVAQGGAGKGRAELASGFPQPLQVFDSVHRSSPSNYYELLGVHPGASTEEVKRAFFSKSKELHPDRDPGNPSLHSRFVELSEAYRVLSREQSRRRYDAQLRSGGPPKSPQTTAHDKSAGQTHSSSWAHPNAQYWSQFHSVRPQGPQSRQQQHKQNKQVLRKVKQMHLNFMDEKDRIITAMYNEARERARARANRASLQQERQQQRQQQPPPPEPTQVPEIVPPGAGP